ncbi:MAG: hypothetical protein Q4A33_01920 [Candidatus Saccharibacteria bacterium]|nr:hypothetical protein [Candidatus Saccharibacteria bacterium]
MSYEINLVPDVKVEMIKALKLRNLIFFICFVTTCVAVGLMLIFGLVVGGQELALNGKKDLLSEMSLRIHDYDDLSDFLTLQNQVEKLNDAADQKNLLSRTFNMLLSLQPTNGDVVEISDLTVNLDDSTLTFHAQADAKSEPFIDYNVLDAFKKSMNYLTYDYGTYVDGNGDDIPAYCIVENDLNGTFFAEDGQLYAYWAIERDGCKPKKESKEVKTEKVTESTEITESETTISGYKYTEYNGEKVVKIWRTPQFESWIKSGNMDLTGAIRNVPHFESECVEYVIVKKGDKITWEKENTKCMLVPKGEDGIEISGSSNGVNDAGELMLRFDAIIKFDPEAFKFANHHLITFGPYGSYNVTDSYTQIKNMFKERAADVDQAEEGEQ